MNHSRFARLLVVVAVMLVAVVVVVPTPTRAAGTVYANSATGSDSTGDGTLANPYLTFHKAYTSATAGDTINLSGTFSWTGAVSIGSAGLDNLEIRFYGPQELLTKPRIFMADRGGFLYSVLIAGQNGIFFCNSKNVTPGKGLVAVTPRWGGGKSSQQYFDRTPKPKNGELLSLTVDVLCCLKNGSTGAKLPASGENFSVELSAEDSVGNRLWARVPLKMG